MAGDIEIRIDGQKELIDMLLQFDGKLNVKLGQKIAQAAAMVEGDAKRNASGRPGPNVQTGNLRARITHVVAADGLSARVGTIVEYAPRLEFGFSGSDSKGRVYNQKPYPFLYPALAANFEKIKRMITDAVKEALK